MQLSCQTFKKVSPDIYIPLFLVFILCPTILFYQRYAVITLILSAIWSVFYLKKILTPLDIQTMLRRQISPYSYLERYLNYGYFILAFCELFRPYKNFSIDMQIFSLLTAGFLWWHAIRYANEDLIEKLRTFLFYGIIACAVIAVLDYACGSLIVAHAEKFGKSRPLIFAKVSMTLSLALWTVLYKQPFWMVCLASFTLICIMPIFDCDTATIGILAGLLAYTVASTDSKMVWRFIQTATLILCLTLPFIFNKILTDTNIHEINKTISSYSYIHRLYIWQYTSQKINERPFLGFGLNSSAQEDVGGKRLSKTFCLHFNDNICTKSIPIDSKQIPNHPHNMILQWWLESGLVGIIWFSMLLIFIIDKISKLPTPSRKITFAFFCTNILILLVSISMWQSWWWATWLFLLPLLTIFKKTEQLSN